MRPMTYFRLVAISTATSLALAGAPLQAHETAAEAANKKVVLDFYRALDAANATGTIGKRIAGIANQYLAPDYIQHAENFALPGPGSARDKLVRMFETRPAMKLAPATTLAVMAEGDLVMMLTARDMPDLASGAVKPAYIFNMFRVKNHRLVEHWDVSPALPGGPPPSAGRRQPATP